MPSSHYLNADQFHRLETLAKKEPSCKVVGWRYWDESQTDIVPIIRYSDGTTSELRPNGRLRLLTND